MKIECFVVQDASANSEMKITAFSDAIVAYALTDDDVNTALNKVLGIETPPLSTHACGWVGADVTQIIQVLESMNAFLAKIEEKLPS
jgi:hypothetical protein